MDAARRLEGKAYEKHCANRGKDPDTAEREVFVAGAATTFHILLVASQEVAGLDVGN